MPIYQFDCKNCKGWFEEEGNIKNPPKRKKCPKCKKQAKRAILFPGMKIPGQPIKWAKSDYNKIMNEFIDDTKSRIENPVNPYATYDYNGSDAQKIGARRLSDEEVAKKIEICRQQTAEAQKLFKDKS